MPWYGDPLDSLSSGVDCIINLLRYRIADLKVVSVPIVKEQCTTLCAGTVPETYYTQNMPIASGFATVLRIDRWAYTEVNSIPEASGLRAYIFNETSGSFYVPSGAIPGTSGDIVRLSYTWSEEQECKFTDAELKLYVQDAVSTINASFYDFGHSISGYGATLDIYPSPNYEDISTYLYVMYSTYLVRKQLESEGFDNRIYVRDLNVTIDTSKGLGDLSKSSSVLMKDFNDVLSTLRLRGQESAFALIDTYSTYANPEVGTEYQYEHRYRKDSDIF